MMAPERGSFGSCLTKPARGNMSFTFRIVRNKKYPAVLNVYLPTLPDLLPPTKRTRFGLDSKAGATFLFAASTRVTVFLPRIGRQRSGVNFLIASPITTTIRCRSPAITSTGRGKVVARDGTP